MSRALLIHHGSPPGRALETDETEVLRATPLLRVLADHEVTWYTSRAAAPLLWGNPLIERVVTSPRSARADLARERFDLVLNLEPLPGCCALADGIRARRRAGYTWNARLNRAVIRQTATLQRPLVGRSYQDYLFALIDRRWSGEAYVLGYRPRSRERYDVGLNHRVSPHAPQRAWSHAAWAALRTELGAHHTITSPPAANNVLGFIDWVNSCRTLITGDSLGLHVALALGKRVVALVGPGSIRGWPGAAPTAGEALPLYGRGVSITPPEGSEDLANISPTTVAETFRTLLRVRRAG